MTRRYTRSDLALLKTDLGAVLPPPPPKKKRNNEEWRIQSDAFSWWRSEGAALHDVDPRLFFSIPNGSVLGSGSEEYARVERTIRGKMLKMAGMLNGIPDSMLALSRRGCPALFVEFKTAKGVLSDEQKVIHTLLRAVGFRVEVCRSVDDLKREFGDYFL